MKIAEGLKSLEKALERELTEFFVILGESEAPEFWPEHPEQAKLAPEDAEPGSTKH